MQKIAIFPGSFDPFTRGHQDVVLRAVPLFDKIIIAIGHNSAKKRYFELEWMKQKISECFADYPSVEVQVFSGLTSVFARETGAKYLLRGLRNTTDFEYENTIAQANKYMNNELETVFLITSPQYAYISSTIVREIHKYDGDVSAFIPYSF